MKQDFEELLRFTHFVNQLREIERAYPLRDSPRRENDSEHSYQVAMVAWYLITKHDLKLDIARVLGYALVHDLVEIDAGDTPFYSEEGAETKHEREAAALEMIRTTFGEVPELVSLIEAYEARTDKESRFIYALDKLLPALNVKLNDGKSWRDEKVTLLRLEEMKRDKIALDPTITGYFEELLVVLRANEAALFRGE